MLLHQKAILEGFFFILHGYFESGETVENLRKSSINMMKKKGLLSSLNTQSKSGSEKKIATEEKKIQKKYHAQQRNSREKQKNR